MHADETSTYARVDTHRTTGPVVLDSDLYVANSASGPQRLVSTTVDGDYEQITSRSAARANISTTAPVRRLHTARGVRTSTSNA